LAAALVVAALPLVSQAQAETEGTAADEQIIMKQVMTDKRAVYSQSLQLTDSESRAFWPIYDEYEAKAKKIDDQFIQLVNDFAEKYDTLTDTDAAAMLERKLDLEQERMALKQSYTKKVAKVLPATKALRYAQVETRIETLIRRNVYSLIPLAR
jgi:hypothetical protein